MAKTHQLDVDFNLVLGDRYDKDDAKTTYKTLMYLQMINVTFTVNEWYGPGGGNNWITFFGTLNSLTAFVKEFLSGEEEYIEMIEEIK